MRDTDNQQVLSLFSGAGGFSYGFAQAGLKPVCGVEIDKDACTTYEANVESVCHQLDLTETAPRFLGNLIGGKAPLAVIGGPPCQGFSTAGARKVDDQRNRLIFHYLQIVSELRPRWFIFENVEGLLTAGNGAAIAALVREFLSLGYSLRVQKVNFAAYGLPQTRKRVLLIGNRLGVDFDFPQETHSFISGKAKKLNAKPLAPTLEEALRGLHTPAAARDETVPYASDQPLGGFDALMRKGNVQGVVTEHFYCAAGKDLDWLALLKPGQTMKDLPEAYWHESFKRRAFRRVMDGTPTEKRGGAPSGIKRLLSEFQSLTITGAATREFIHPIEHRPLTLRECARLQSFPDRYQFFGTTASVAQQIGNAVPPLAAAAFARHLLQLDGLYGSGRRVPAAFTAPRLLGFILTEADGMSPALKQTEAQLARLLPQDWLFA